MRKLLLMVFTLLCCRVNAQVLPVPTIIQERDNWCWSACSKCILDYYNDTATQCDIAEYARTAGAPLGSLSCCSMIYACNLPNYMSGVSGSIQDILLHFGNASSHSTGAISLAIMDTQAVHNLPFVIHWTWLAGGGHFVVGNGVDAGGNVHYMNPWVGEGAHICTYGWMQSDGEHIYDYTLLLNSCPLPNTGTISGSAHICNGTSATFSETRTDGTWSCTNATASLSGNVLTGLLPGKDTILYTVSNVCGTSTGMYPVTIDTPVVIAPILGPTVLCNWYSTTLLDATPGGTWSLTNVNANITATGIIMGITPGVDTIQYSIINGCGTFSQTKEITILPLLAAGPLSGPSLVCAGDNITLSSLTPGGTWYSGSAAATVSSTGVVTGVSSGTTTIYYTIMTMCSYDVAMLDVTVASPPSAGTLSGPAGVCLGSSIMLGAVASGGTWFTSNALASVTAGYVSGLAGGVDTIYYSVTNTCGSDTAQHVVTIDITPSAGSISGAPSVCAGSLTTLGESVPGGTWSASNTTASVSPAGIVTGVSPGVDTFSYLVANTCGIATASFIMSVVPMPDAGIISGAAVVCESATITLSESVSSGAWSTTNASASASTTGIITGVAAGVDTVVYSVSGMCGVSTATFLLTVNPLPAASTISGPTNVCVGAAATLSVSAGGGLWSVTNSTGTVTAGIFYGITAGIDTVVYTITNSCGSSFATHIMTIDALPVASTISGPASVCEGATITLAMSAGGGIWSVTNSTAGITAGVITGVSPGIDTVTYTTTSLCGSVASTYVVSVNPLPLGGIISSADTLCMGATYTLSETVSGGAWTCSNGNASIVGSTISGVTAGTVTISYTVTNGCGTAYATHALLISKCNIAGIGTEMWGLTGLHIYPNPGEGAFAVTMYAPTNEKCRMVITNLVGQAVYTHDLFTNTTELMDMGQIPGIYLVTVISPDAVYSAKLVIR